MENYARAVATSSSKFPIATDGAARRLLRALHRRARAPDTRAHRRVAAPRPGCQCSILPHSRPKSPSRVFCRQSKTVPPQPERDTGPGRWFRQLRE
jgi:hypothetical protein